jgi:hypothetical protein
VLSTEHRGPSFLWGHPVSQRNSGIRILIPSGLPSGKEIQTNRGLGPVAPIRTIYNTKIVELIVVSGPRPPTISSAHGLGPVAPIRTIYNTKIVELIGIEPTTSCMPCRRSPS